MAVSQRFWPLGQKYLLFLRNYLKYPVMSQRETFGWVEDASFKIEVEMRGMKSGGIFLAGGKRSPVRLVLS